MFVSFLFVHDHNYCVPWGIFFCFLSNKRIHMYSRVLGGSIIMNCRLHDVSLYILSKKEPCSCIIPNIHQTPLWSVFSLFLHTITYSVSRVSFSNCLLILYLCILSTHLSTNVVIVNKLLNVNVLRIHYPNVAKVNMEPRTEQNEPTCVHISK